jgi:hypothetical protein
VTAGTGEIEVAGEAGEPKDSKVAEARVKGERRLLLVC